MSVYGTLCDKAEDCKFINLEEMIRDLKYLKSVQIREKLLYEEEKLTLHTAAEIAQSSEYAQTQLKSITGAAKQVDNILRSSIYNKKQEQHHQIGNHTKPPQVHKEHRGCQKCNNCGKQKT